MSAPTIGSTLKLGWFITTDWFATKFAVYYRNCHKPDRERSLRRYKLIGGKYLFTRARREPHYKISTCMGDLGIGGKMHANDMGLWLLFLTIYLHSGVSIVINPTLAASIQVSDYSKPFVRFISRPFFPCLVPMHMKIGSLILPGVS
ncbi:unnamed protein product [Rhizoctonia solani]|uniref:Uncharacterized protein n=1 Tax=Rhizoctonia solani TaxID=456999 RepID=A0A8H2WX97_9AGAM|nr:unnamed protein product [Rhizoctonia solani]